MVSEIVEYMWLGGAGQFVVGIPARDLTARDLLEIGDREGITRADVEVSGLYVRVDLEEVAPFCGQDLGGGRRCRRRVRKWGQRCYLHDIPF